MQTGKQLTKVNLWNKDNCLFIHKTNLGLVVESVKESLIKRDAVTFFHIKIFRKGAVEFITLMLLKLFQRSVSGFILLRCGSIFNSSISSDWPKHKLQEGLKSLLKHLIEIHVLTPKTYDQAVMEFNNFLYSKAKKHQFQFYGFGTVKINHLIIFNLKTLKS